ncbi:MAG: TrbC/VirB2 family protein [bacterium]|nr:TrbC/VirB2 family protein [bacterium]
MSNKMSKISRWGIAAAMMAMPLVSLATVVLPGGDAFTLNNIESVIDRIATYLMVIGITIAVIYIIWGGIKYMTARGDAKAAEEAKGAIINGVIGAAVVFGVGVILRTVSGLVTRTFFS